MNKGRILILILFISFTFCSLYAADLESEKTYEVEVNGKKESRLIQTTCKNGFIFVSFDNRYGVGFDSLAVIIKKDNSIYTLNTENQWIEIEEKKDEILSLLTDFDESNTTAVETVEDSFITNCRIRTNVNRKNDFISHSLDSIYIPFGEGLNGKQIYLFGLKSSKIKDVLVGTLQSEILAAELTVSKEEIYKKFSEDSDIKIKTELATLFAFSIQHGKIGINGNNVYYPGNIEENCSYYLQCYFDTLFQNKYPVLTSQLYKENQIPEFEFLDSQSTKKVVDGAERYLDWAVEYSIVGGKNKQTNGKIFENVDSDWALDNDKKEENYWPSRKPFPDNGNPVPYVKGGIDTPRTFWKKMKWIRNDTNSVTDFLTDLYNDITIIVKKIEWNSDLFVPGTGDDIFKFAGTDDLGFLAGVLSMSGHEKSFVGKKNCAAEKIDSYSHFLTNLDNKENIKKNIAKNVADVIKDSRYSEEDLEYFTVLVPKLAYIKPGDIVVQFDNDKNISIGIVSDVPADNIDASRINVIYFEKNTFFNGISNGFAVKKSLTEFGDNCTIRRLVVNPRLTQGEENYCYEKDVLDPSIEKGKLVAKKLRELESTDANSWRFIPNTGEYLVFEGVQVLAQNKTGVNIFHLYPQQYQVDSFIAKDRSYEIEGNVGNLYKNKTDEMSIALIGSGNSIYHCRTLSKNDNIRPDLYSYSLKNDYAIVINNDGLLNATQNKPDMVGPVFANLGIRPVNCAKAYPGDDFILGLQINGKEIFFDEKDYVAVYDKKMLWRANLYIQEESHDWNNEHPWNVPYEGTEGGPSWWNEADWGCNEWNKSSVINGGQVEIYDWTRFTNDSQTPKNAVAYGWGCWDSVEDFNGELLAQKDAISNYNGTNVETYNNLKSSWANNTIAPQNNWLYYIFDVDHSPTNASYKINSCISVPGLTTYVDENASEYIEGLYTTDNVYTKYLNYSSGIDCSGLVERCMSYTKNNYSNSHESNNSTETKLYNTSAFKDTITYSLFTDEIINTSITSEGNLTTSVSTVLWDLGENENHRKILTHSVPGDLLVIVGHVVIIQDIDFSNAEDGSFSVDSFSNVAVIHSVTHLKNESQNKQYKVRKGTWENIQNNVTGYRLRRIKIK